MKADSVSDILLSDDSRLLTEKELDALTLTSRATRWRRRREGRWPPRVSVGGRSGNTLGQIRSLIRKRVEDAEALATQTAA